eukprot:12401170-Ditylum_brightwellii.AAC.1
MAWYQPKATPPDPLRYNKPQQQQEKSTAAAGGLFSVDSSSDEDEYGGGRRCRGGPFGSDDDELQRRIETLISPMLPSSAVLSTKGRSFNQTMHPHPSFRYHESPPPLAALEFMADDEVQHFFYPRPVSGRG